MGDHLSGVTSPEGFPPNGIGAFFAAFFFRILVLAFVIIWPVVAWHRYLLLEEAPTSWIPRVHGARIVRYLLNLIGLGFLVAFMMLPIGAVMVTLFLANLDMQSVATAAQFPAWFVLTNGLVTFPVYYMSLRFCLILPGAAVHNHLGLGGAWGATAGSSGTMALLAGLGTLCVLAVQIAISALGQPLVYPGDLAATSPETWTVWAVLNAAIQLMSSLFVVALLTTLYRGYVQKLPLD